VHWKELGIGLYPKKYGDMAFSGSAVVDKGNTSGWGTKAKPPLVLAYTSTARGECIAYSNDNGRTWTEYDKNPVVKHAGRDPKLVWYEKGKHWVMAVYDEFQGKQWIAFYTSPDLKTWIFASRIEGFFECPDLFEMPISNEPVKEKWVLYAADGKYLIGDFDGKEYKPDFKQKKQLWYGRFYAAQTFENVPDEVSSTGFVRRRRVQIGWANGITFPGMPFNQQMTVPVELRLGLGSEGKEARLIAIPVIEIGAGLRDDKPAFEVQEKKLMSLTDAQVLATNLDAFDVWLAIRVGKSAGFALDLRGTKLVYDAKKETLTCKDVTVPVEQTGGMISLRVLVDRGSVEAFTGEAAMSVAAIPDEKNRGLKLTPHDGEITIVSAAIYRMKSAWEK